MADGSGGAASVEIVRAGLDILVETSPEGASAWFAYKDPIAGPAIPELELELCWLSDAAREEISQRSREPLPSTISETIAKELETAPLRGRTRADAESAVRRATIEAVRKMSPDDLSKVGRQNPFRRAAALREGAWKRWRGMTLRRLSMLLPVKADAAANGAWDAPLEWNPDIAARLLYGAVGFQDWVVEKVSSVANFGAVPPEVAGEARKNSSTSPPAPTL